MRFTVEDPALSDRGNKNGVLASYVAQNIRLGRYRAEREQF